MRKDWHPETDCARLIALSDGIFSVSFTLAVVMIFPPDLGQRITKEGTAAVMKQLVPDFLWVLITFMMVGLYWIGHNRMFHHIKRADRRFLLINLLFLVCVALMPFPVKLSTSAAPDDRLAVAVYAGFFAAMALALHWIWSYATMAHRLVEATIEPAVVRYNLYTQRYAAAVFLLSIGISSFSPTAARWSWMTLLLAKYIVPRLAESVREV